MSAGTKLFVYGVNRSCPKDLLEDKFAKIGAVSDVYITEKGYAFVTMVDEQDAHAAVDELNGANVDGQEIKVEVAHGRGSSKPSRGGGGGRGYGDRRGGYSGRGGYGGGDRRDNGGRYGGPRDGGSGRFSGGDRDGYRGGGSGGYGGPREGGYRERSDRGRGDYGRRDGPRGGGYSGGY